MVTIDNATTPEECFKCSFFEHEGVLYSDPRFYLNAKCKRIGQSIGQDITKSKRYPYIDGNYAIMEGERWSHCPLGERNENAGKTAKIIMDNYELVYYPEEIAKIAATIPYGYNDVLRFIMVLENLGYKLCKEKQNYDF